MNDREFLNWVADRLVHVHGDDESADFMRRLRLIAEHASFKAEPVGYTVTIGGKMLDELDIDSWPKLADAEEFAAILRKMPRMNAKGIDVRPVLLGPPVPPKVPVQIQAFVDSGGGGWI